LRISAFVAMVAVFARMLLIVASRLRIASFASVVNVA
jgi:hypothetical protein